MSYPWPHSEIRFSITAEEGEAYAAEAAREGQSLEGWVRAACARRIRDRLSAEAKDADDQHEPMPWAA